MTVWVIRFECTQNIGGLKVVVKRDLEDLDENGTKSFSTTLGT
jgi:hypothetical protein